MSDLKKFKKKINHKPIQQKYLRKATQLKRFFLNVTSHSYLAPSIYITLSLFVFFILIIIFNTYILRLKVETAVVNVPIETVIAPASGYIADIYVRNGQQVKKGDPLVKIENIDLERDLRLALINTKESQLSVKYYQNLLANEQQKLKIYQHIGTSRVISADSRVNSSTQDMLAAEKNLQRLRVLYKKHYISKANWDNEFAKYIRIKEKLRYAKAQKNLENSSLKAVAQGVYFTGNKLEGLEQDLHAELTSAKQKEALNQERVKLYSDLTKKLILKAPFDGTINQVLKSAGNTTDTIKPIVLIEQTRAHKNIVAYLTQNEIAHIGSIEQVKIYLPSTGKVYKGKITEINRTDGFIDVIKAQFRWRNIDMDRSGMVTIDLELEDQKSFNGEAFAGMPAIIYFSKRFFL
jgi:multidrug resistance efflux pump